MNFTKNNITIIALLILSVGNNFLSAQSIQEFNTKIQSETIEALAKKLNEYVIPKKGIEIANALMSNFQNGQYDSIDNFSQFVRVINQEMFKLSRDTHLRIYYSPQDVANAKKLETLSYKELTTYNYEQKQNLSKTNFGFEEIKIFPGNIGYIKLNQFIRIDYAGETAAAAMNFLLSADAIIFDLRDNTGGWPSMVDFLLSYFLPEGPQGEPIFIYETHYTFNNKIVQSHTLPYIPGKRRVNVPLYILTSSRTWSAAESFSYSLKHLGRATIVGERTKGGAHPTCGPQILTDYLMIQLPLGNPIYPQTNSNWEGVGVEPDIFIDSDYALEKAMEMILPKLIEKIDDESNLNNFGYSYISVNMLEQAIYIFQTNIEKHPNSSNCYDSLGEAYMINGEIELALLNYEKSLELDPTNDNARRMIEKMKSDNLELHKK